MGSFVVMVGAMLVTTVTVFGAPYFVEETVNDRPIIGILAQHPPDSILDGLEDKNYTSYIAASYVKYLESAGARVVPILTYQSDEYYDHLLQSLNGFLFPGGSASITNSSGYGAAGQKIYDYVLSANSKGTYLPLWGTCLGYEMLTYLSASNTKWLSDCSASNKADALILQAGYENSRMFKNMPIDVTEALTTEKLTINFHRYCVTPENFTISGLSNDYLMLSTSYDFDGLEYVALIEHKTLPLFGSQFHPEKNPFEWAIDEKHDNIPHTDNAILAAQYFSNFFVNQARLNSQSFASENEEMEYLIYNYDPLYTAKTGSSFQQAYLFRNKINQTKEREEEENGMQAQQGDKEEGTLKENTITINNFHYDNESSVPFHLIHYFQYNISNSIWAN